MDVKSVGLSQVGFEQRLPERRSFEETPFMSIRYREVVDRLDAA